MNAHPDVRKLVHQTQRYEYSDGLRDLQLALMMAGMGFFFWLIFERPDLWIAVAPQLKTGLGVALLILMPLLLVFIPLLLIRYVRKRWLWRNSGYIQLTRWIVPRRVLLVSALIVFAALGFGVYLQTTRSDFILMVMILIGSGWSFAYSLVEIGRHLDLERYVRVGFIGAVANTIILILPLSIGYMGLCWGVMWGVLLAVSGYGPLRDTIRQAGQPGHE